MSLKKLSLALLAVVVLGAVAANGAYATNEFKETGGAWYTGASPGTKLPAGTTKALTATAVGIQKAETTLSGTPLDITATGISCVSCVIKNVGTAATIEGKLEFTGVTVSAPVGCTVPGGTILTNSLTAVLGMNTAGTVATLKFAPQSGATLAAFTLDCPTGTYKLSGVIFAQATNVTGMFAANQEFKFSRAIEESAGEASSLKFGENIAFLTGGFKASIGATEWAGKEK